MNRAQKILLFWAAMLLLVIAIYNLFAPTPQSVSCAELRRIVAEEPQRVDRLTITGTSWRLRTRQEGVLACEAPPPDQATLAELRHVPVQVQEAISYRELFLHSWLPMLGMLALFYGVPYLLIRYFRRKRAA